MLASLCFLLAHSRLDETVSLTAPAAGTASVLAELSRQAGVPLLCTTQFRNDVLVLRLKDVPLKDAMDKIAETVYGDWQPEGNGFRLVRTSQQSARERAKIEADDLQTASAAIQKKKDAVAKMAAFNDAEANSLIEATRKAGIRADGDFDRNEYERQRQLASRAPAARLIDRILAGFLPRDLIRIKDGMRVVFSTQPTRMQVALPGRAERALEDFLREQAIYSAAAKAHPRTDQQRVYYSNATEFEQTGENLQKVLLIVTAPTQQIAGMRWSVELKLVGPKGRYLTSITGDLGASDANAMMPPKPDPKEATFDFRPSPTTASVLKFARAMMGTQGMVSMGKMNADSIQVLSHPEKVEPLSLGCSELLIQGAEARGKNLVAVPSDEMAATCLWSLAASDKPTWTMVRSGFTMADGEFYEDDGWITVRAKDSLKAREFRVDRQALGKLLQSIVAKGRLALDDAVAFAMGSPRDEMDIITMMHTSLISGEQTLNGLQDFDALRIYGGMNAVQKQNANSTTPMTIGVLTPVQRQALVRMVYQSSRGMTASYDAALSPDDAQEGIYWGSTSGEPTEALPDGLPNSSTYSLMVSTAEVVKPEDPGSRSWSVNNCFTADMLAGQIYMQDHVDKFPWMANQGRISFDKVRYGSERTYNFSFRFTKTMGLDRALKDATLGEPMPLTSVPKSFLDALAKATAEQADRYKFQSAIGIPGGGTRVPPPHR